MILQQLRNYLPIRTLATSTLHLKIYPFETFLFSSKTFLRKKIWSNNVISHQYGSCLNYVYSYLEKANTTTTYIWGHICSSITPTQILFLT